MSFSRGARHLAVAVVLSAVLGCAEDRYFYMPSALENRVDQQSGSALYPLPENPPKGNARVQSMGIVDLKPKNGGDSLASLHIRLTISNQDQTPWTLSVRDQSVVFPNRGSSAPVLASVESEELAAITILPHELRSVDLYFPMPPGLREADKLPEFDFHWQVHAGGTLVARTTSFTRWQVPDLYAAYPYPYDPYWAMGWGGWWWGPPTPSFPYRS